MQTDEDNPELMVQDIFTVLEELSKDTIGETAWPPVIGGAWNFKSKENPQGNFFLKLSLSEKPPPIGPL